MECHEYVVIVHVYDPLKRDEWIESSRENVVSIKKTFFVCTTADDSTNLESIKLIKITSGLIEFKDVIYRKNR